nr:hypothetical protein [Desulfuromonas sp.]
MVQKHHILKHIRAAHDNPIHHRLIKPTGIDRELVIAVIDREAIKAIDIGRGRVDLGHGTGISQGDRRTSGGVAAPVDGPAQGVGHGAGGGEGKGADK